MIALICPTRQRPQMFKRMAESAFATASDRKNIWIYSYTADDDPEQANYPSMESVTQFRGPDWPIVMATNYLAGQQQMDNKKLLMLVGDDAVFSTPGWDKALLDAYEALPAHKIHVFSLQDSRDTDGTPHPIMTREYVKAMGYMVCPIFLHWFVDTWAVAMAKANGCFTHLRDYLLVHDKGNDRGAPDLTHNRLRRIGWHVRDHAVNDTCQHFLEVEKFRLREMLGKWV